MKYNSLGEEERRVPNMPCWYYDKADLKKTPSFLDGINAETEARYRREGPRFIFDMGTKLGLHHDTIATGIVFFHRFYMFHSFKKFPRHITATCCLFLAGKVEETPKKCKDLIKVARSLLNEAQFAQFGDDPKEEVLTFEKVLLQTIKFDLTVEHPYKYMLQYAKALKGERSKIEKLVQMSWTFINDSLCTSLCLQWEPQIVAVAVMYLAGRLCKFEPQDWAYNRGRWWEQFIDDISPELLEDICHQVLDQYSQTKGNKAGSSSKTKRERPKTPGDVEKSSEPQAKTSKSDHKSAQKTKAPPPASSHSAPSSAKKQHTSSTSSSNKIQNQSSSQRRSSSNTEVVAMDTVDTGDRGSIEQGKPPQPKPAQQVPASTSKPQTPTKPASEPPTSFYNSVNQYQSYMGTSVPASLGFGIQPNQFTAPGLVNQFPGPPALAPQTPPVRQSYGSNIPPPPPQNFHPFPPIPGSFDAGFGPNRFPHTPPSAEMFQQSQNQFPSSFSGQPPTGLATVRITGRRDQKGGPQWS